ncbi:nuclease-related domain-containing protein [Evansella sp. AB-rgal1]|uniref:nuclease-related domain-containing protein n=1 Tax=Evansella sp. AB-rgal1 TaxID=3242696 RepID=UPI00359EC717
MIIKPRTIPKKILKLRALLFLLSTIHPKRLSIEGELGRREGGYRGEQSLDYYLSFLENEEYYIFQGLRLSIGNGYFYQIDTYIATLYFTLALETKNMSGTIHYDNPSNPVVRTHPNSDREPDRFDNPIEQVKHQARQHKRWLQNAKFPSIPLEHYVVNTNSKAISKAPPEYHEAHTRVIHASLLLEKIEAHRKEYTKEILQKKDLRKLSNLLIKHHTPEEWDIFHAFDIPKSDIYNGIRCPKCSWTPMKRVHGRWGCSNNSCDYNSENEHVIYLKYYGLLIGREIKVSELMAFLKIDCRFIANRILHKMNFPSVGECKGRVYYIPEEFIDDM